MQAYKRCSKNSPNTKRSRSDRIAAQYRVPWLGDKRCILLPALASCLANYKCFVNLSSEEMSTTSCSCSCHNTLLCTSWSLHCINTHSEAPKVCSVFLRAACGSQQKLHHRDRKYYRFLAVIPARGALRQVTYEACATPPGTRHGLCCFHWWTLYEARGNDAVPKNTVFTTLTCKPWC